MDNLTDKLLVKHYNYDITEWVKQGNALQFGSGKEQRIVGGSIPAIELQISYRGLSIQEYEAISGVYENNHSNTFILDLGSFIDLRPDLLTDNGSVWTFKEFQFSINASKNLYDGTIKLITSVFFNFTAYQSLFAQSSSYTASPTSDESFINLLDEAPLYQVDLKYENNSLTSNVGQSSRHIRNKGGLKRTWTAYWLCTESQFIKVLTFYRKKSGIMGVFGMPRFGSNVGFNPTYMVADYVEDQSDYVAFDITDGLSNARFAQDSLQYNKRVDGIYIVQADIIEVKQ